MSGKCESPKRTKGFVGRICFRYVFSMKTGTAKPSYLAVLEETIVSREATVGFRALDELQPLIAAADPAQASCEAHAIPLALCYAQWIDLGYTRTAPFEALCGRIESLDASALPVLDFLRWQLVKAFRAANIEELNEALHCLEIVETAGKGILPGALVFLTAYWKGRWHRRRGEYDLAWKSIKAAQEQARLLEAPRLVAVTKLHESWLVSQKGDRKLAFTLLDEAEAELLPTGHALSLGNIESARGRFVRRSGEYTRALAHFEKAIVLFSTIEPEHVNLARALVNAAYVKRLIALDRLARSRASSAKGAVHQRHLKTVAEALELLHRARAIYAQHHHQGGTGSVLVNAGHLHLESGDIDQACVEAVAAFRLGEERSDTILMARARILQSAVALERAEEQLDDDADGMVQAHLAIAHADEALALAHQTQNRRLLAGASLARGRAAAQSAFEDWETARTYVSQASELLRNDDRDHLLQELQSLKSKVHRATGVDEMLRRWSEGDLGGKTFLQVEEEFAEIVIPKVWMQCGKSVTRVAEKLSISPKKVRRILQKAVAAADAG